MAKITADERVLDRLSQQLGTLERVTIRRLVEAGADAAGKRMAAVTQERRHVRTGDMLASIGPNEYRETLGGGRMDVYPQGDDRHGIRNATKAYVINYGRGGTKHRGRMGDLFITRDDAATEDAVDRAMNEEMDRIVEETNQ